jgi:thymidylate synthase
MVAWPKGDGSEVNQLDRGIERLISQRKAGRRVAHISEIGLGTATEVENGDLAVGLPVYVPGRDNSIMGFPCLSHISLTLSDGRVHMTAVYRNHEFIRRAYGNYLGLGRLLAFVARESGWEVGGLVCISSHADAEVGKRRGFGKGSLEKLVADCGKAASR